MNIRGIKVTVNPVKNSPRPLFAATATKDGMVSHGAWSENQDDTIEHAVWQIENGYAKPAQPAKTTKHKPSGAAQLIIADLDQLPDYHDWRK